MAVGLKPEIVAEPPSESAKWSWATVYRWGDKWEGVEVRSENRKCWKNRQQRNRENERGVKLIGVGGVGEWTTTEDLGEMKCLFSKYGAKDGVSLHPAITQKNRSGQQCKWRERGERAG